MIHRDRSFSSVLTLLTLGLALAVLPGCVDRTITITSEPSGALVWLNDQEIGRTPVTVDFLHYGTYDVRLVLDGYEPMLTVGEATTPVWDLPFVDLAAEAWPGGVESSVEWHYELEPIPTDLSELTDRARAFRDASGTVPPPTDPDSDPDAATEDESGEESDG